MSFSITSFYRFVELDDYFNMKPLIFQRCQELEIMGTILLAQEGINGSICGKPNSIEKFFDFLNTYPQTSNIHYFLVETDSIPFSKLKVKIRNEIVRLGANNLNLGKSGQYVQPSDWDDLIHRDDVVLIDTRNNYEINFGKFANSINPKTSTFREFIGRAKTIDFQINNKKIAMYCTSGIRCEKSTSYMRQLGYKDVYHLNGGIISYLSHTSGSSWKGKCFVFDDRVALNSDLSPVQELPCSICNVSVNKSLFNSVVKGKILCAQCSN